MTQLIYKDIGIEDEGAFGASVAGTATRIHVRTIGINQNPNKAVVEQTGFTAKGRDVMTRLTNAIEGDITAYATPKVFHELMELGLGSTATVAAAGTSASLYTYVQNTNGLPLSKSIQVDRVSSQEKYSGVVGKGIQISGSDNMIEITVPTFAKTRTSGTSMADVAGEQTKPLTFADINVTLYAGSTPVSGTTALVKSWSIDYQNNFNPSYLSGSRNADRADMGVPSLTGSMQIYHENSNYIDATYGCSEYWLRIEGTLPSCAGLVAGVTPHYFRIDVPRIEMTTNVRNYEQAAISIEDIEFTALVHPVESALIVPKLTSNSGL